MHRTQPLDYLYTSRRPEFRSACVWWKGEGGSLITLDRVHGIPASEGDTDQELFAPHNTNKGFPACMLCDMCLDHVGYDSWLLRINWRRTTRLSPFCGLAFRAYKLKRDCFAHAHGVQKLHIFLVTYIPAAASWLPVHPSRSLPEF